MSIDPDFPKNHQVIVKHSLRDGDHFHFAWGPGRLDAETSTKPEVQEVYKVRGEEYVPLGVHGTMVAVDWDSCYADGACIVLKHVRSRYSNGIEQNKIFRP
jgi:NAD-dependent dihydropyrimidine dehydrogenase PreA subunit